jgi:hypothetical protein
MSFFAVGSNRFFCSTAARSSSSSLAAFKVQPVNRFVFSQFSVVVFLAGRLGLVGSRFRRFSAQTSHSARSDRHHHRHPHDPNEESKTRSARVRCELCSTRSQFSLISDKVSLTQSGTCSSSRHIKSFCRPAKGSALRIFFSLFCFDVYLKGLHSSLLNTHFFRVILPNH